MECDGLDPTADRDWVLEAAGYDPLRESTLGTRFAISNGFLGVRGERAMTQGTRWVVPARTYVAGLFDTPGTEGAVPGLVPVANWLKAQIVVNGRPMVLNPADVASHHTMLDMKRGVLLTSFSHSDASGISVRFRTLRLVSLAERSVGLQVVACKIEAGEAEITLDVSFAGANVGLIPERLGRGAGLWRTRQSGKRLAMATDLTLRIDGTVVAPSRANDFTWVWHWKTRPGQSVWFERLVAMTRGDDPAADPATVVAVKLDAACRSGWRGVLAAHQAAWAGRWQASEVQIGGDVAAQQAIRFALYHLNSAANPDDPRVSIAARALTGDDYRGHVFWDTEIYLLPFYVLTWPEAARALLMYRFHTIGAARAKAERMGWRGALYAWESADTGEETTPDQVIGPDRRVVEVLCGRQEQHISADVAYAVWQYWQATGDERFLLDAGAEIILETGRFWASRAQPEADGRCHIRGVMGPDEYHPGIDDNAYTNVMARWNISRALEVAAWLRARWPARWTELDARLGLNDAELADWSRVVETLATGLDPDTGLYAQFDGFLALEAIDLAAYADRSVPMDVVLGRDRTQRTQVVKQADVVALLALLPQAFPGAMAQANFAYYEPRCSHGSSLSPALHGLVAARLGLSDMALRYFRRTAAIDLGDAHVGIDGGIHIAAQGGLWMMIVFGFAGLSLHPDALALKPHLPPGWTSLGFAVNWRGRHLRIRIAPAEHLMEVVLDSGDPMQLIVNDRPHDLDRERPLRVTTADQVSAAPRVSGR